VGLALVVALVLTAIAVLVLFLALVFSIVAMLIPPGSPFRTTIFPRGTRPFA
jgi:uncharacterized membrane protein